MIFKYKKFPVLYLFSKEKSPDFYGATRLSYRDSSDCEAIVTYGEDTFLIKKNKKIKKITCKI